MAISELHLLLTYECNLACPHCFVWGSPAQRGTMNAAIVDTILDQAHELGGIDWIYFEGGEPFLHHSLLHQGIRQAAGRGFRVGLVTNAFWAVNAEQAHQRLRPLKGMVQDFTVSIDEHHGDGPLRACAHRALEAARALDMPVDVITVEGPEGDDLVEDGAQPGSELMYRGRAAARLADRSPSFDGRQFDRCPWEDLADPGRVHLDPLGWVHVCQGITIGNYRERSLRDIFADYDPQAHPVVGPLLRGGPAELAGQCGVDPGGRYADACHLCYQTRCAVRHEMPGYLGPGQMYGCYED